MDIRNNQDIIKLSVNTIRMLSADAVQKANSGHPGMPMGMADCAFVLWTRFLRFNPEDPQWINRDRFVLSAGHGSMLLYSMLHLSGYDLALEDLQQFRQWESRTPGHPEYGHTSGVETTTGPLGQGVANGVGMALAQKILSEKFNTDDFSPIDHHVYGIIGDGDVMEGVSAEAISLAGHLGLGNLIYFYDDNHISIEGNTNLAFSEDVAKRFEACGWHTVSIDGHNHDEIIKAVETGISEKDNPTLILARTHIGYGSPNKQDSASAHGSPLGDDEIRLVRENLDWPDQEFHVPESVRELFNQRVDELKERYRKWQEDFKKWQSAHTGLAAQWNTIMNKVIPDDLESRMIQAVADKPVATRASGGHVLQVAAELVPGLYGGSADLAPSTKTLINDAGSIGTNDFSGRNIHFGVREHGMGGILNGMSLYGGIIPYGSTFFVFSDYMRPSVRLSALMKAQVIYVFTHDSFFVGEDGPTHQPVEHLAAMRVIPDIVVFRPADGLETALAWAFAIRRQDGPTAICLTRQSVPPLMRLADFQHTDVYKGGYVVQRESNGKPDVIFVATGSEVSLAMEASIQLKKNDMESRIVSMPSLDLFYQQPETYRNAVIPDDDTPVVVVEAGIGDNWHGLTRSPLLLITMDRFGASAPAGMLKEKFGFTPEKIVGKIMNWER